MNYKPTRQDFERFLKDSHQIDAPFFYEQWILDNFRHLEKPLEEGTEMNEKKIEHGKLNKDIKKLSKNALICYLLNELGHNVNWEVTTYLTDDGCWTGAIDIRFTKSLDNDDVEYFKALAARN